MPCFDSVSTTGLSTDRAFGAVFKLASPTQPGLQVDPTLACSVAPGLPACVRLCTIRALSFIPSGCFSEMKAGAALFLLLAFPSTCLAVFQCPSDGHHVDPESCASFYMCANGRVISPLVTRYSQLSGVQYDLLAWSSMEWDQERVRFPRKCRLQLIP